MYFDPRIPTHPPETTEHPDGSVETTTPWAPAKNPGPYAHRQARIRIGADYVHVDVRFRGRAGEPPTPWYATHRARAHQLAGRVPLPITPPLRLLTLWMAWLSEFLRGGGDA